MWHVVFQDFQDFAQHRVSKVLQDTSGRLTPLHRRVAETGFSRHLTQGRTPWCRVAVGVPFPEGAPVRRGGALRGRAAGARCGASSLRRTRAVPRFLAPGRLRERFQRRFPRALLPGSPLPAGRMWRSCSMVSEAAGQVSPPTAARPCQPWPVPGGVWGEGLSLQLRCFPMRPISSLFGGPVPASVK